MKTTTLLILLSALFVGCSFQGGSGDYGSNVTPVTESSYKEFVSNDIVVLDFWAEWCGPCRKMKPIFTKVSDRYVGRAHFGAVDVDAQPRLAEDLNIRAIPTIVIFKSGKVVETLVGIVSTEELAQKIDGLML